MVADVLKEFTDVIPLVLPKTLPPCGGIDHCIELELGVKPLARTILHGLSRVGRAQEAIR